MWTINVLLLMLGTVSAMLGISFYFRNQDASGKIRFYILFYGLSSALWCICYGLIGFTENLEACEILRKIGIVGVDGFLLTDFFLVSELSGVKRPLVKAGRIVALLISVTDYFWFAQDKVDEFIREGAWTTWKGDPAGKLNRTVHTVYIVLIFSMLLFFGVRWILNNQLRRHRRFMFLLFLANFIMLGFTLPDTFLPARGRSAISTSGLGAAVCTVVMWYGASQLNSFDIRTGNIKDRIFDFLEAGIIVLDPHFRISMVNRYAMQLVEPSGKYASGAGTFDGKNRDSGDAPRGLAPWRRRRDQGVVPQKLTDFFDIDASTMGELFAYAEMLGDFTAESEGKLSGLEGNYAEKDWHQYQVQIHALKSVLRMLGAAELSDRAKALEDACKNNDEQYIHRHHAKMMDAYRDLVEKVKECLL